MASDLNFDPNSVKPNQVNEPLPNGWYVALVTASDVKPTKDGKGRYLELEFEVLDEGHKGRKVWDRLNLQNPSEKTVRIAEGQLSALCHAAGVLQRLTNSAQLHGIPVRIRVVIEQSEGYEPRNVVKGYKGMKVDVQPVLAAAPATGRGTAAAAPQARSDAPPWAQR